MTGVELIAAERQRQMDKEGWTPEHDDEHVDRELNEAAVAYVAEARWPGAGVHYWPRHHWGPGSFKPSNDPIRNLVKAGALIAAEIDRLQRAGEPKREELGDG